MTKLETFGDTQAAFKLYNLVKNNRSERRKVTAILCRAFTLLKDIQKCDNYTHLSGLIIKDFEEKMDNTVYDYSSEDVKTLMVNLVKTKRKVTLRHGE